MYFPTTPFVTAHQQKRNPTGKAADSHQCFAFVNMFRYLQPTSIRRALSTHLKCTQMCPPLIYRLLSSKFHVHCIATATVYTILTNNVCLFPATFGYPSLPVSPHCLHLYKNASASSVSLRQPNNISRTAAASERLIAVLIGRYEPGTPRERPLCRC